MPPIALSQLFQTMRKEGNALVTYCQVDRAEKKGKDRKQNRSFHLPPNFRITIFMVRYLTFASPRTGKY